MTRSAPAAIPRDLLRNATSGFLVFLVALPLCLGISIASGFPPVAGILTAVIGGLVTSHTGGAPLTIKGPAAGLIVIAIGAVTELGMGDPMTGYRRALAVGVIAALLQIVLAVVRADRLATVMPPSVVHGMLAAIGVIILAKQTPVLLGVQGATGEPLEMLLEIPHYVAHANPAIALIGAVALATLLLVPRIPGLNRLPAPLAALLVTVPLADYLGLAGGAAGTLGGLAYQVNPAHLVRLPGSLLDAVTFPDFSVITSATSIKYIAMFAIIGSVESLLSALAVDAIDPEKRASNLHSDLLVTGVANLLAASIGGLPMISEIVRSKANIDAGATNAWSNFFHGAFLLGFVALAPGLLQHIPLAALAAMLIVTGARLASPKEFEHAYEVGPDQLAVFTTTAVVTLGTDLLVGVAAGLALKLALHIARAHDVAGLLRPATEVSRDGARLLVRVTGPLAFTNLLALESELREHVNSDVSVVEIDLRTARLIDHTVQERLAGIANEWRGTKLELVGLELMKPTSAHAHAFRIRA